MNDMRPLKTLRETSEAMQLEERKIRNTRTVEENVRTYLMLYRSVLPLVEEAKGIFERERIEYLTEFQQRLRRLDAWRERNESATESGGKRS